MDTEALRPHGRLGIPRPLFPSDEIRSSPPPKSGGILSSARHPRTSPRHNFPPGGRSPSSHTKPSRKNSNGESGGVSVTPGRRSRIPEPRDQMVVKFPVRHLVMEEVTILKRGEEVRPPRRPAEDALSSPDRLPSEHRLPSEDRRPSQGHPPLLLEDRCRPSEERRSPDPVEEGTQEDDLYLCSTDRLGPDPGILPKQLRIVDPKESSLYSGSGFYTSPSPKSLPFPTSFFRKKEVAHTTDFATKGLRYLLRLDLP